MLGEIGDIASEELLNRSTVRLDCVGRVDNVPARCELLLGSLVHRGNHNQ